ncbi:MAG: SdrD B-like domain-containing protein [Candidatus Dactylopiibacterium sp.]|nr:SdrD B-like domain-containing protein [Candidatus Dactylopiibacterium sp.]
MSMGNSFAGAPASRRGRSWLRALAWGAVLALAAGTGMASAALRVVQLDPLPSPVAAGGTVTSTVSLADTDSLPVVTPGAFLFEIPADSLFQGTGALPAGVSCSGMTAGQAGPGTLNCSGITLAAAQTVRIDILLRTTVAGTLQVSARTPDAAGETKTITVNAGADLGVVGTAPAQVAAGSTQTLQWTVTNHGPNASPASTLTYSIPPGFVPTASLPGGCTLSASTLSCSVGALASGASRDLQITGVISVGGGSTVTHTADIAAGGGVGDGVDVNNTASLSMSVTPGSSLRVQKAQSPSGNVTTGSTFSYVLTPTYSGDFPVGVQVTDNVPANFSFAGASPFTSNGWTCTASSSDPSPGPGISCTHSAGSGAAGHDVPLGVITIPVKALSAGSGVVNTASITAPGVTPASGSASTVVIDPVADFRGNKGKSWPQATVPLGQPFDYTISSTNLGPSVFSGVVTLTDNLPAGLRLNRISAPAGFTCTLDGAPVTLGAAITRDGPAVIVCQRTVSALAVNGASGTVTLNAEATVVSASIVNGMCVTTSGGPADEQSGNNCASVGVGAQAAADQANIRVLKRVSGPGSTPANRQEAGKPVTWQIEVVNDGPVTATNVRVTDSFASVVGSPSVVSAIGGVGSFTGCAVAGQALSNCVIGSLPVCQAGVDCPVITVSAAHHADGASSSDNGASVDNSAYALADSPADTQLGDNTGSATAYLEARADVSVVKAANPATVPAGQLLTYTITVSNPLATAASRADDVEVRDSLPANLVFLSAVASGAGTCTSQPAAGSVTSAGNDQLVCRWASINRGAQQTVTVRARVLAALMNTSITNTVAVSTTTPQSSLANDSATVVTPVAPPAYDLLVQKLDDVDPVNVGDDVTYTLTVTNNGASTAENVVLTDTLPSGPGAPTFVEVVSMPAGVTYTTPGASVGAAGGRIVFTLPALGGNGTSATGETSSAQVKVRLRGASKGSYANQARVEFGDSGLNQYDPQGNNTTSESTYFRFKADVEMVSKQAVVSGTQTPLPQAAAGQVFDWLLRVRNNGPDAAETTTFSDTLPSGMEVAGTPVLTVTAGTFDPVAPVCTTSGNTVSCLIASMPALGAATVRIPARLTGSPANGTTFSNTASIVTTGSGDTNGGANPNAGNNFGSGGIVAQTSVISGRVYHDANGNGAADAGESGLATTITLTGVDLDGHPVSLSTTSTGGVYSFAVPAGTYSIVQTQPAGYAPGITRAGTVTGSGSAAGTVPVSGTGVTSGPLGSNANAIGGIVVGVGGTSVHNDFGEVRLASVGGRVYHDADYSGGAGATDPGIAGVRVDLAGTDMFGNAVGQQGTSAAGTGDYGFDQLWPGTYALTETQPARYLEGADTAGSAGGNTSVQNAIGGIVLASGAQATGYDFGELLTRIPVVVFEDGNNDGSPQAGENGIPGVTVRLSGTDAAGNAVDILATPVGGQPGRYEFRNVPPSGPAGYVMTETQPAGYAPGKANANGNPGTVDPSAQGNVIRNVTVAASGAPLVTGEYYFGELVGGGIRGRVFYDRDGSGLQEAGEPGIAGVSVQLTGTGLNGNEVTLSTLTDAAGNYSFADIGPGTYTLSEVRPATYLPGLTHAGTVSGAGSTAGVVPVAGSGVQNGSRGSNANRIENIVLGSPGAASSGNNFSAIRPASLAGSVYADVAPSNGVRDAGEPGIANVRVVVSGTDFHGNRVERVLTTDADGQYAVTDLLPGTYQIDETQPAGMGDGIEAPGSVAGAVRGVANPAGVNDRFGEIVLMSEEAGVRYDFGERGGQLGGYVYADSNLDGVRQTTEPGIGGVTVTLSGVTAGGVAITRVTTTDAQGHYAFSDVLPADAAGYTLTETQPPTYADGTDAAGQVGGVSTGVAGNDVIRAIAYAGGEGSDYNFGERGASLAGLVYNDVSGNAARDPGDLPLAGVTITLSGTDASGQPVTRSVQTAPDGSYRFTDLPMPGAGGYTLTETQPAGYDDVAARAGSLGGTTQGANQIVVSFGTPGVDGTGYDFFDRTNAPASLSGNVWRDANHDRLRGEGEAVVAGWTVELLGCADGSATCGDDALALRHSATTAADGSYRFDNLVPGEYLVRFRSPGGQILGGVWPTDPVLNARNGIYPTLAGQPARALISVRVAPAALIVNQDLPLDPGGIVYDSLNAEPVAGAVVTLQGPAGFDPAAHVLGGTAQVTTGADGYYDFFLLPGAPAGDYTIGVLPPAGYVLSPTYPAAQGPLDTQACSAPAGLLDSNPAAPCVVSALAQPAAGSAPPYYLAWRMPAGGGQHVVSNHIPLDPQGAGTAIELRKTSGKLTVKKGELVPYVITARNTRAVVVSNVTVVDTLPPGFRFMEGSMTLQSLPGGAVLPVTPQVDGRRIVLPAQTFAAGESKRITLVAGVGVGVGEGQYVNQAAASQGATGQALSNVASAAVRVVADALFDCTDVIGKVFDDRNANGYQDEGEPGIAGVRVATVNGLLVTTDAEGRYHIACAAIPKEGTGSNFVLKLDVRTLPSGYRVTTGNPADERVTRGKLVKINFGATVHRVVRLDLRADAFEAGANTLRPDYEKHLDTVIAALAERPSILRLAYAATDAERPALGEGRIEHLKRELLSRWRRYCEEAGRPLFNPEIEVERVGGLPR